MYLFRLHLRPDGGKADKTTTFDYCVRNRILGVGWRVANLANGSSWDEFQRAASAVHDGFSTCTYIHTYVKPGDLVWTRSPQGEYFLARATSGWKYWIGPEGHAQDIDIANVFDCDFVSVPLDAVPGKVVACFRPRRAMQEIASPVALEVSKLLWNRLSGTAVYTVDPTRFQGDIFTLLDDKETEDLVFLYLQHQGWKVVPGARQTDTMSYEFYVVQPHTGEIAVAQVKTGEAEIDRELFAQCGHRVFLFQPNSRYVGLASANLVTITREELLQFFREAWSWLPQVFRSKAELCSFT